MKKRFLLTLLASVFALTGMVSLGTARALDDSGVSASQRMMCGLWAGSNLSLSLDAANCQGQSTSQTTQPISTKTYAALGDSVAAGLGLSGSSTDTQCGRSSEAYSTQVASALGVQAKNYSCSGATVGDLFTTQHLTGPNNPAQIKQAFKNGKPDLITITAGANDAHWADFIKACQVSNCATNTNTHLANRFLISLQAKLYAALLDIRLHSRGTPPQVVLTGYYQAFSDQCAAAQTDITPAELTWIHDETVALNQTIQQVSSHFSFAKFAPVDFTGHDICSSDPWIQRPGEAASFHPNLAGQTAIAQAILKVTD
jgi:lysophospholipase L1-like esterase